MQLGHLYTSSCLNQCGHALPMYNPAIPPEVTPFLSSLQLNPKNTNGTFLDGASFACRVYVYGVSCTRHMQSLIFILQY